MSEQRNEMSQGGFGFNPEGVPSDKTEITSSPEIPEKKGSVKGNILNVADYNKVKSPTLKKMTISAFEWNPIDLLSRSRDSHEIDVVVTFDEASGYRTNEEPIISLNITDKHNIEGATWVSQEVINQEQQ